METRDSVKKRFQWAVNDKNLIPHAVLKTWKLLHTPQVTVHKISKEQRSQMLNRSSVKVNQKFSTSSEMTMVDITSGAGGSKPQSPKLGKIESAELQLSDEQGSRLKCVI